MVPFTQLGQFIVSPLVLLLFSVSKVQLMRAKSLGSRISKGGTDLCENLEGSPWLSQNMKNVFGSFEKLFCRKLSGTGPQGPGHRRVVIKAQPVGSMNTVSASLPTVRSRIAVD